MGGAAAGRGAARLPEAVDLRRELAALDATFTCRPGHLAEQPRRSVDPGTPVGEAMKVAEEAVDLKTCSTGRNRDMEQATDLDGCSQTSRPFQRISTKPRTTGQPPTTSTPAVKA